MKFTQQSPYFRIALLTLLLAIVLIMGHWSLNTLANLFNGTEIQFKHTVSAFVILVIARWVLFRPYHAPWSPDAFHSIKKN